MATRELRVVLTVDDLDRAAALLRDALGLPQVAAWENDGGRALLLDAGHATIELFDKAQAAAIDQIEVGRRVAGQFRLAIQSDDSSSIAEGLVQAGAVILAGPVTTPWGDVNVRLEGPDGIQLTLFTPPKE